jgi:Domain of unknown function (DUF222)
MFDELVAETAHTAGADAVAAWARVEAAACARRLTAMVAMLDAAYAADGSAQREQWCLDNWGAVSAAIGAAQHLTAGAASHQLLVAVALRDRLPRVGALFTAGLVGYRLVDTIVGRTALIREAAALRAVDAAMAEDIMEWNPMSIEKTIIAIDALIDRYDPHAVRRTQSRARGREVQLYFDDGSGLAALWGRLFATDAKALDRRLDALAGTVCAHDPRTADQRRADALGALAQGHNRMTCRCDQADCHAANSPAPGGVLIHVVTNQDTLADAEAAATQDAALDGEAPPLFDKPVRELTLTEALVDTDAGEHPATAGALIIGGSFLPGAITRRAALNATIKTIVHPGASPPEPRYRPSAALAQFVRCRDLTCRFPDCDEPADHCDLDHTIPYPHGPTQASNLKCLCRKHHLLKTFWAWRDEQHPDGSIVWTAPSGQTYTTHPGSRLFFPALCQPTAPLILTDASPTAVEHSSLTMPLRKTIRTQARAQRIHHERRLNKAIVEQVARESIPPF